MAALRGPSSRKGEVGADFGLPTTAMLTETDGTRRGFMLRPCMSRTLGAFIEVQVFDSIAGTAPHFQNKVRMGNLQDGG